MIATGRDADNTDKTNSAISNDLAANVAPDLSDSVLENINVPTRPSGHRPLADFILTDQKSVATSHEVVQVLHKTDTEIVTLFFKKNSSGTVISELEATAANFYRVLAPSHIPPTFAVYEDDKYVGVVSEAIPEFKSTAVDEVNPKDLCLDFIDKKNISIEDLEKIDADLQKLEDEDHALQRKIKKIEEEKKEIQKALDQFVESDDFVIIYNNDEVKNNKNNSDEEAKKLKEKNQENVEKRRILEEKRIDLGIRIRKFKSEMHQDQKKPTPAELDRYRIVKGLAIALTTSYIFMEDDLHRNNLSKDGKRIDFDMSLWPLLYDFKDRNFFEKCVSPRKPNDNTYAVSAYDILHFPNVRDYQPYFWPNKPPQAVSSTTIKSALNYAANDYLKQDNQFFLRLQENPVFKHHKYTILTKYILTTPNVYYQVAAKNIHTDYEHRYKDEKKPLIKHLVKQQESRIAMFQKALVTLPEFGIFFKKHHEKISAELLDELAKQNIQYPGDEILEEKYDMVKETAAEQMKKLCHYILNLIETNRRNSPPAINDQKADTIYGSAAPIIVNEKTLKIEYEKIEKTVRNAMNAYINPVQQGLFTGAFSLFGWMRNHKSLAISIINKCDELKESLQKNKEPTAYSTAIKELYECIVAKLDPFEQESTANKIKEEPKEMHKELLKLQRMIKEELSPMGSSHLNISLRPAN